MTPPENNNVPNFSLSEKEAEHYKKICFYLGRQNEKALKFYVSKNAKSLFDLINATASEDLSLLLSLIELAKEDKSLEIMALAGLSLVPVKYQNNYVFYENTILKAIDKSQYSKIDYLFKQSVCLPKDITPLYEKLLERSSEYAYIMHTKISSHEVDKLHALQVKTALSLNQKQALEYGQKFFYQMCGKRIANRSIIPYQLEKEDNTFIQILDFFIKQGLDINQGTEIHDMDKGLVGYSYPVAQSTLRATPALFYFLVDKYNNPEQLGLFLNQLKQYPYPLGFDAIQYIQIKLEKILFEENLNPAVEKELIDHKTQKNHKI